MVKKKVEVLVAGGGTAGVIAGLAAARGGANTLIIEKQRCLGGQFTVGMQGAWVGFSDKEKVIVKGIAWELRNRLHEKNAMVEDDPETDVCFLYDPEIAKLFSTRWCSRTQPLCLLDTSIVDVIMEGIKLWGSLPFLGLN